MTSSSNQRRRWILHALTAALLASCTATQSPPQEAMSAEQLASFVSKRRAAVLAHLVNSKDDGGHLGSAIPISADGYLLTAAHVLSGTDHERVEVLYNSGPRQPVKARVVWVDPNSDTALLKIESATPNYFSWTTAPLASGTPVVHTGVTTAHLTGVGQLGRAVPPKTSLKIGHSLRIKPGDSGGALVTLSGELVGVNSAFGTLDTFGASFFATAIANRPSPARINNVIARDQHRR